MLGVLDLFAGIGGFSLGLERTGGFKTIAFCEIDKKAQLVLKKHWPNIPVYEDIKELSSERLQEDGIVPTVITGGFPCQDISGAGKGAGIIGERSGLWAEMFRLIRDVRPAWSIIENVSALRSKGLTLVLQDLCSIGYCAEWHCIPASAVGAPHQRDRIWILAHPLIAGAWDQPGKVGEQRRPTTQEGGEAVRQGDGSISTSRADSTSEDVAYPMCKHSSQRGECEASKGEGAERRIESGGSQGDAERERSVRGSGGGSRNDLADSNQREPQDGWIFDGMGGIVVTEEHLASAKEIAQWEVEPEIPRVVDGFPGRVDRLKQLGNAVVPQIPEILGRAILALELQQKKVQ